MYLRKPAILLSLVLLAATSLLAEGTRTWEQSKYEDFLKGTTHGVAISSVGTLQLAPSFKPVASTPSSAVWAAALGSQGEIYAATGAPARVYRIAPGGQPVAIFQPQELQVQALVLDKNGVLYAATNPDGKVYKIEHVVGSGSAPSAEKDGREARRSTSSTNSDSDWKASVYFDPATKYIWSLALDGSGDLYVATGDHGEIFRVTPSGGHSLFFKSDEPHIRTLAFDAQGNLIAGSDGSGLVYRINPKGEGFVLYSAQYCARQFREHLRGRCRRKALGRRSLQRSYRDPGPQSGAVAFRKSKSSRTSSTSSPRLDCAVEQFQWRGRGRL